MRLRTIVTAAAVPAVTAGLLLTATAASAATTTGAVTTTTTAAVTSPGAVSATTYEHGLDDTTNVTTGKTDPTGNGPIWAYDNVKRVVSAVPDQAGNNTWDVTVSTTGSYAAFANPLKGFAWNGHGPLAGYVQYVVQAPPGVVPSAKNLPYWTDPSYRSQGVVNQLFGLPRDSTQLTHVPGGNDGQYNFVYFGIPGAPGGLYFQHS